MSKIISASRRTDIPAFYSKWFMNRIRQGYAIYRNPFFREKTYTVDLRPDAVSGIYFWTRYPEPIIPSLDELNRLGYAYCFLYTITNYPRAIEPGRPDLKKTIAVFKTLSEKTSKKHVIWRYDPIILNQRDLSESWHKDNFKYLVDRISGLTEKVIISIVDPYKQTKNGIGHREDGVYYAYSDYLGLLEWMVEIAHKAGLFVQSCAEEGVHIPGILKGACVDAYLMDEISGKKTSKAKHVQRKGCLCHRSVDIGAYNTCIFGCRYCYANQDHKRALVNNKAHHPAVPLLI